MGLNHIQWLLGELPALQREGVIDDPAADRLRRHYAAQTKPGRNWALTAFGILGGTLIGLGILLLLAHNWADLSRVTRTALAFAPLVASLGLAGWVLAAGKTSAAWRESVGLFWMLSVGTSIALVAQTYHIPGDAGRFALTWMLLTLPIVYLLQSTGPALVYLAGITFWATDAQNGGGHSAGYWLLAALLLPHTISAFRANAYSLRASLLGWGYALAFCVATGITLEKVMPGLWIMVYAGLFACLYLAGTFWFDDTPSFWQRPFRAVGSFGAIVLALMLTYRWPWNSIGWRFYRVHESIHPWAVLLDYVWAVALPVAAIALLVASVRRGKAHAIWLGALPIVAVAGYSLAAGGDRIAAATLLFNAYLLAVGLAQLIHGLRRSRLGTVNGGLFVLFALILIRFFDAGLGFIARGLVFVALGIAFLLANLFLARRKGAAS